MKTKLMFRWKWQNTYRSLIVFYAIMLAFYLLTMALTAFLAEGDNSISTQSASGILLLVHGIILFPQSLRVGVVNGVSRRSIFCGCLAYSISIAVLVSVVDLVLAQLLSLAHGLRSIGMISAFWDAQRALSPVAGLAMQFIELLLVSLLCIGAGYFISGAYYRMSKALKITVSIGVPVLLFVALPILIAVGPPALGEALGKALTWCVATPGRVMGIIAGLAALCFAFVWLLMRKAALRAANG